MLLTTCNHCSKKFKVRPDQLEAAQGLVRCGNCKKIFQANNSLESITENESDIQNSTQQEMIALQEFIKENKQILQEKTTLSNQSNYFHESNDQVVVDHYGDMLNQTEETHIKNEGCETDFLQDVYNENMEFIIREEDFVDKQFPLNNQKNLNESVLENVDDNIRYEDDIHQEQQVFKHFLSEPESTQAESSYGEIKRALSVNSITLYYPPETEQQIITSEENRSEGKIKQPSHQNENVSDNLVEKNTQTESIKLTIDEESVEQSIKKHITDTEQLNHSREQSLETGDQFADTHIVSSDNHQIATDDDIQLVDNTQYRPLAVSDQNIYLRHQQKTPDIHSYEKEFNWMIASFVAVIVLIIQMFYLILS